MQQVDFITNDGVKISGDYYLSTTSQLDQQTQAVLLVHMMPATKESWSSFAEKLKNVGFHVLAIDLRGHGVSAGGPDGYQKFFDKEHQASIHDIEAAAEFLKNKGIAELFLGGASIGANLSLQFAADHPEVKKIILLSPGLNYYSIVTEPLVLRLQKDQNIYFIADEDDMRKSGDSAAHMATRLFDLTPSKKQIKIFKGAGHGTNILIVHPEFETELVGWLLK